MGGGVVGGLGVISTPLIPRIASRYRRPASYSGVFVIRIALGICGKGTDILRNRRQGGRLRYGFPGRGGVPGGYRGPRNVGLGDS